MDNLMLGAIYLASEKLRAILIVPQVEGCSRSTDSLSLSMVERYETDIKFHADMHFNMVCCWGGGLAERTEFYHYCDIYGLLVWQEFWSTEEIEMVTRDTVNLLRNHPSLALSVGENKQVPLDDINKDLENVLRLNPYFENSNEISKSSEDLSVASKDPSQYLDATRVYIQGPLWDGFANIELCGTPKDLDDFCLESSAGGPDFP
nr:mannosylglycoprotein endo-beta-mannosidase [Quercus suber]